MRHQAPSFEPAVTWHGLTAEHLDPVMTTFLQPQKPALDLRSSTSSIADPATRDIVKALGDKVRVARITDSFQVDAAGTIGIPATTGSPVSPNLANENA